QRLMLQFTTETKVYMRRNGELEWVEVEEVEGDIEELIDKQKISQVRGKPAPIESDTRERSYAMDQVTVRAAGMIPEGTRDLAAGVPANEILVIIAKNVDEYNRVAHLEVENRVEIQVVNGEGVDEIGLEWYQILNLKDGQYEALFGWLMDTKYMDGIRLNDLNELMDPRVAEQIHKNV
ncbi:MAG: hypothetical protein KJ952_01395, partial [Candidatus Omnitrophica bacterium]|nr:hypothetical protein [Candidatus Omnitrophota bacterium]